MQRLLSLVSTFQSHLSPKYLALNAFHGKGQAHSADATISPLQFSIHGENNHRNFKSLFECSSRRRRCVRLILLPAEALFARCQWKILEVHGKEIMLQISPQEFNCYSVSLLTGMPVYCNIAVTKHFTSQQEDDSHCNPWKVRRDTFKQDSKNFAIISSILRPRVCKALEPEHFTPPLCSLRETLLPCSSYTWLDFTFSSICLVFVRVHSRLGTDYWEITSR